MLGKWVSLEFLAMVYDTSYEAMIRVMHGWYPPSIILPSGALAIHVTDVVNAIGTMPHWNTRN